MCAVSKLVVPAILAGLVVATLTNQAVAGWIVAAAVGGLLYLKGRRRAGSVSCALPPGRTGRSHPAAPDSRPHPDDAAAGTQSVHP